MEIKLSYEESSNPLKDGWKIQIDNRYAYLTAGEVLEFIAALLMSKSEAEERMRWLKTEEEHAYINTIYDQYIKKIHENKDKN